MAANNRHVSLVSLSKRFHYTPRDALANPAPKSSAPKLILLFAWMGAPLRHVQKYVDGYANIWPSSPIILVQSLAPDWRPLSKFARDYPTLIALLKQHEVDITSDKSEVLMAVMSNGGCWSATALLRNLPAGSILRPKALIYDSCPGIGRFGVTLRAFLIAGKYRLLRKVAAVVIITLYYFLTKLINTVAGLDPVRDLRNGMIHRIEAQRRAYIYSDTDDIILSVDVEAHARQSMMENPGETTTMEKFHGSGHVGHLRVDEDRYWQIVKSTWDPPANANTIDGSYIKIDSGDLEKPKEKSTFVAADIAQLPTTKSPTLEKKDDTDARRETLEVNGGRSLKLDGPASPPPFSPEETMAPAIPITSLNRADTISSTTSSTSPSSPVTRELFGGAMTTTTPSSFLDASTMRQVPDHQEVFLDSSSDEISLIVELTEILETASDEDAIKEHFDALSADNESSSSRIISVSLMEPDPSLGPSYILVGMQTPRKFNHSGGEVMVILGLIRLKSVSADLLISMNFPCTDPLGVTIQGSQPHRRSRNLNVRKTLDFARGTVETAITDFRVIDWSLFPEAVV